LVAWLALSAMAIGAGSAAAQSIGGRATAASVNTLATGSQTFASANLPQAGGMESADDDAAGVPNTLTATGLSSSATGQIDDALVSATATAEAAEVAILNGLIRARAVLALATSYANGTTASSEAKGSTLLNLVIAGVPYADGTPAANKRVDLPGVGYVVLNEQVRTGDGVHSTSLTVNMIHVFLVDPLTGAATGEIVVGSARSTATL
jgi:hypothetical protein